MPRIYISREESQAAQLSEALRSKGFLVDCQSQIRREFINFTVDLNGIDWLFFSSPYAVESYFSQEKVSDIKIAALGSGTARALEKYTQVHFTGEGSSTKEIGERFLQSIGKSRVLFPSPEKGLRAVQSLFPKEQFEELICYRTMPAPKKITEANAYVFSSPSNVHAFALENSFPKEAEYFAFGPSTALALEKYAMNKQEFIQSYEDEVLIQAIFSKFVS